MSYLRKGTSSINGHQKEEVLAQFGTWIQTTSWHDVDFWALVLHSSNSAPSHHPLELNFIVRDGEKFEKSSAFGLFGFRPPWRVLPGMGQVVPGKYLPRATGRKVRYWSSPLANGSLFVCSSVCIPLCVYMSPLPAQSPRDIHHKIKTQANINLIVLRQSNAASMKIT